MSAKLNRDEWLTLLEQIAGALGSNGPPIRLCLIGSVACVFGGMSGRTSRDLDVWRPASDYDRAELRRAVEATGMLFDPKTSLEPGKPYLQIIDPGPTQVGIFEPVLLDRIGRLEIYRPPIEHLIASKLARGDARDIEDVLFLAGKHRPNSDIVRSVAET
ncbi:MAG: hypothetical protein U0984_05010, partial [Prosthecobacter sp.]|nr:hypothetical protein [Prosthecobacter sp.]